MIMDVSETNLNYNLGVARHTVHVRKLDLTSDFFLIPSHCQWHQKWQKSHNTTFGVVLFTEFEHVGHRFFFFLLNFDWK